MEKPAGDTHIERVPTSSMTLEKGLPVTADEDALRKSDQGVKLDYSGAAKKTDPAEIKLVRKLDLWIMPMQVLCVHNTWFNMITITGYG